MHYSLCDMQVRVYNRTKEKLSGFIDKHRWASQLSLLVQIDRIHFSLFVLQQTDKMLDFR